MMNYCVFVLLFVPSVLSRGSERIFGGIKAEDGTKEESRFPFVVAIYPIKWSQFGLSYDHFCGGTLLEGNYTITAASCIHDAITVRVVLGSYRLKGVDVNRRSIIGISWEIHPDYNPKTGENDIALIQLPPLEINNANKIRPIPLTTDTIYENMEVTSVGWGQPADDPSEDLNNDLRYVNITVLPLQDCIRFYKKNFKEDTMVCARGNHNEGACKGDIGGGLIYYVNEHHPTLAGVSSFLYKDGCKKGPSGYTRIFPYIDWIETVIGPLDFNPE